MSGIYIPGMAMPAEQTYVLIIAIQSDGRVFPVRIDAEGNPMIFQNEEMQNRAIPVPPHGRLIDADALRQSMYHEAFETDSPMQKWDSGCWIRYKMFERLEGNAPTIIEAEVSE